MLQAFSPREFGLKQPSKNLYGALRKPVNGRKVLARLCLSTHIIFGFTSSKTFDPNPTHAPLGFFCPL